MRKILILVTCTIFLLLILLAGCGDDDCPTCQAPTDYLAWTDGIFYLQTYLHGDFNIWAYTAQNPFIDSVKVGDSLCGINSSYYHHGSDLYYYCQYNKSDDQYVSGDTAVITMYGSGRTSTCRLPLLDYDIDESVITVPSTYDTTVYYGEDMSVVWNKIDKAEWYGIEYINRLDSNGTSVWTYTYTYTYDTTFAISDTVRGHPVIYSYFYPVPCTGPNPTSADGNWQGTLTSGKLYCYADNDACRIYFENYPTRTGKDYVKPVEVSKKTPGEIIKKVYEAYK